MKTVFEAVIRGGNFDLPTMLNRINYHHIMGNLTDADLEELTVQARAQANALAGLDIENKLLELDARVTALEKSGSSTPDTGDAVPEYTEGKWYYKGDKVTFNGAVYTCIAPTGVACVWNPEAYPAYWEKA